MSIQLPAPQTTNITTIATTDILDARSGANDTAHVKKGMLTIRNKGAADNTITLRKSDGSINEIDEFTLVAEELYINDWDMVFRGTTDKLELVSSSTSALDVVVSFIEETP